MGTRAAAAATDAARRAEETEAVCKHFDETRGTSKWATGPFLSGLQPPRWLARYDFEEEQTDPGVNAAQMYYVITMMKALTSLLSNVDSNRKYSESWFADAFRTALACTNEAMRVSGENDRIEEGTSTSPGSRPTKPEPGKYDRITVTTSNGNIYIACSSFAVSAQAKFTAHSLAALEAAGQTVLCYMSTNLDEASIFEAARAAAGSGHARIVVHKRTAEEYNTRPRLCCGTAASFKAAVEIQRILYAMVKSDCAMREFQELCDTVAACWREHQGPDALQAGLRTASTALSARWESYVDELEELNKGRLFVLPNLYRAFNDWYVLYGPPMAVNTTSDSDGDASDEEEDNRKPPVSRGNSPVFARQVRNHCPLSRRLPRQPPKKQPNPAVGVDLHNPH